MKRALLGAGGVLFGLLSLFFGWYSVRLVYVNIAVPGVAAHRQAGMYIGGIVFPIATAGFGWISWFCWRRFGRLRLSEQREFR